MKILQLVQKPQRRGAESFAYQLSRELRQHKHLVRTVYLYAYLGTEPLPLQGQDCLLAGHENHPSEKIPGVNPHLLRRLRRLIDDFTPDVVQVNGTRTVKYGALARYFFRHRQWVLIYRNIGNPKDWVQGWARQLFYRRLVMSGIDGVVGVSRMTLRSLTDFYPFSVPTACIPTAVDPLALHSSMPREAVRKEAKTPLQAPVVLFIGSLTPEKRLDRLLRVVQQVRVQLPEVYLWIVGDGPLRPVLEEQIKSQGLTDSIRLLGVQEDVAAYINAADLFLLTSDTEGVPGVILEAGFLGLPVVATRVGGIPECVLHEKTGILVDPRNEEGLAQATLMLLRNPQKRITMGDKAREWIREHFIIDKIARQYVNFYQEVLARARQAQS